MKKTLAVLLLAALLAGCATGRPASGATSRSRRIPALKTAAPKSAPAKVSFGGENRTRANFWNSR